MALDRGSIRRVGVGAANGRHFLFHLGAGFDAAVVARIEATPGGEAVRGPPRLRARHRADAAARLRPQRTRSSGCGSPDGSQHESFFSVVSNVAPYTYVGPTPDAAHRDASLDRALALTSLTRFTVADVAGAVRLDGRSAPAASAGTPTVVQRADLDSLRLTAIGAGAGERFPWQVDGDYLGDDRRARRSRTSPTRSRWCCRSA